MKSQQEKILSMYSISQLFSKSTEAMADLNTAIEISKGKGRAACQAFTQRAMIHRLQGNDDLARDDFQAASNLGSEFAKAQVSNSDVEMYI